MTTSNAALATRFLPDHAVSRALMFGFMALVGTALLTLSAKIKVPFYPAPMTMQTFALMAIVAAFGLRLGVATVALYLAQGAAGLPVFTGTPEQGIGLAYMAGPTGGYLAGFLLAAVIVGYGVERGLGRNTFSLFGVMLIGNAVIFALGLVWMGMLFGWDKPILEWGFYPFIAGDLVKTALAAALIPALSVLAARLFRR